MERKGVNGGKGGFKGRYAHCPDSKVTGVPEPVSGFAVVGDIADFDGCGYGSTIRRRKD